MKTHAPSGPMSYEEMLEFRAEFTREVARLRALPANHRDKSLSMKGRKLSEREVRYLEALERFRNEEAMDFGGDFRKEPSRQPSSRPASASRR